MDSPTCLGRACRAPAWMSWVVLAAGVYHLAFAVWVIGWPHLWFDWSGLDRPNFMVLWRGFGVLSAALGAGLLVAARSPVRHWALVLTGFAKSTLMLAGFAAAVILGELPLRAAWLAVVDDLIWWPPFAAILWAALQAHAGRPARRDAPLTPAQAAAEYRLSTGELLAEAAQGTTLTLVFLRHFGCMFTRQLLRGLEHLEAEAQRHGSRLVLVHMLEHGRETAYLGGGSVARIADPMCELYRAFGLGKGGFFELFGPRVWWRGALALFRGCGVGHLAGDGLQMPGAFLFRDGRILAAQPARSAADLPDLKSLFAGLPAPPVPEKVPA